jgi:acyl carrier protein
MSTPREAVIKAILVQMNIDAVSDTDRLVEDLRMDSLDILEAVMAVESELDIRIDDDQVEALNTVGEFVQLVEVSV